MSSVTLHSLHTDIIVHLQDFLSGDFERKLVRSVLQVKIWPLL